MNQKKKRFNMRVLTSLTVTLGFLCLAFSGIVLYFSPKGRVANWTGWTMFGLEKEEWGGVHTILAIMFVLASALHIYFNWRPLLRYFTDAIAKGMRNRLELAAAALITLVFFTGALMGVPPFGTVLDWGEDIKDYWERTSGPLPYPHAEESTLAEFAKNMGVAPDELAKQLAAKGFEAPDLSMTVKDFVRTHKVTPNEVLGAIPTQSMSAQQQGLQPYGGGFGQKTLEEVCEQNGIELKKAVDILERQGVKATGSDKLKSLADQAGTTPRELLNMLTVQE